MNRLFRCTIWNRSTEDESLLQIPPSTYTNKVTRPLICRKSLIITKPIKHTELGNAVHHLEMSLFYISTLQNPEFKQQNAELEIP